MNISELMTNLPASVNQTITFSGDSNANFEGLAVRPQKSMVQGRCYFLVDEYWIADNNWPMRWESPSFWSADAAVKHVALALSNEATSFVISRKSWTPPVAALLKNSNYFIVNDSYETYFHFARVIRRSMITKITAITGSAGKTTTTEMLSHAFRALNYPILSTKQSQNVGVSVVRNLTQAEHCEHAALEVSQGACQVFTKHAFSVEANVAVITEISAAHLEEFDSVRDIALTKSAIFDSPPPGGVAVICLDSRFSHLLIAKARKAGREIITYGETIGADIHLLNYDQGSRTVSVHVNGEIFSYKLALAGRHMAVNSLAVIGVLRSYGIAQWREGMASLYELKALNGRGEEVSAVLPDSQDQVRFIDESFNSNPSSVRAVLETFLTENSSQPGRKVALLGDMLQLGAASEAEHRSLATVLANSKLDAIILFGKEMKALHEELSNHSATLIYFPSLEELIAQCSTVLQRGDLIVAKASHGTGLHAWLRKLAATSRTDHGQLPQYHRSASD